MIAIGCVILFTAVAAVLDLRTKKLPNLLTVPAFGAALVYALVAGAIDSGWSGAGWGVLDALGGFGVGFGILFVLWLVGGGGAGDVKFMGALGAWLGVVAHTYGGVGFLTSSGAKMTFVVLIVSTLFAAIGSAGVLAWQASRLGLARTKQKYLAPKDPKGKGKGKSGGKVRTPQEQMIRRRLMPFACPVALATWSVLAVTEFIKLG